MFEEVPFIIPFVLNPEDEPVRQTSYIRPPAGRPMRGLTSEMRHQNWLAAAEARRRAVELADGRGLMVPLPQWRRTSEQQADVDECWDGSAVDLNEVRAHPILWNGESALIFC